MNLHIDELEKDTFEKYSGKVYKSDSITKVPTADAEGYSDRMLRLKLEMIAQYTHQAVVLDLCCGTGEHLLFLKDVKEGIGLDFSAQFIEKAKHTASVSGLKNIRFEQGNAREMAFRDNYFDLVYCLAALYHIPKVDEVIREIARVLKPGGKCVLDMGNLYSLNTIVCKAYPEIAHPFHISVATMERYIHQSGLSILRHRSFQILPMWADRPKWLKPLLWQGWTRLLTRQVKGKMLDEWISNSPIIKSFAFRHIFLCQKGH